MQMRLDRVEQSPFLHQFDDFFARAFPRGAVQIIESVNGLGPGAEGLISFER